MGVKNLNKILRGINCTTAHVLADYAGKVIGIDASMAMHQWAHAVKLTGPTGAPTSHLIGMFYRTVAFIEAGVVPVYVFDGPSRVAKAETVKKRSTRPKVLGRGAAAECQELLALMGVQFIVAPAEADAVLAALCRAGTIYAVASEDTDMFAFGAPRVLRGFSPTGTIEEYSLDAILRGLDMTQEQFLHMCVILGTDYGNPFHGIGLVNARAKALAGIDTLGVPKAAYAHVLAEFTDHPLGDLTLPPRGPIFPNLRTFLTQVHGMDKSRVDTALARVQI
jgi:flap endonuclease-1